MFGTQNQAGFKVTLDGRDLGGDGQDSGSAGPAPIEDITGKIGPRLISLTVTEKRGGEADQLDLVVHDHDGLMALPKKGARLRVAIGWVKGVGVPIGLVDKGSFKVDEVEYSGSPDLITIRARSADFASGFRVRRERSHRETTLGALIRKVAAENGLVAHVAPELAGIALPVLSQEQKSDMALIRELGRRFDAVATVKDRRLVFSPIGKGATASGAAIPAGTIRRSDGDSFSYRRVERGQYDGVEARWHDRDAAERKTVKADGGSAAKPGGKPKRLKKVFHSEDQARSEAEAEAKRIKRAAAEFDYTLALGRPDLYPERRLAVSGFKPEIDAQKWLIAEAAHTLDAGGLSTKLKLETA